MRVFLLAAALLLAGCGSTAAPATPPTPVMTGIPAGSPGQVAAPGLTPAATGPVTALRMVHDPGRVTGTLTGPCHLRGQLPDPRCTPGAYDPQVTAAVLCSSTYRTSAYRPPASQTDRFKRVDAFPAYGLADIPGAPSELDHLVPLELGGSNDASNLWPELGAIPNRKDAIERQLHDAVCTGLVTLSAAQAAIATNWETAERTLGLGGTS